MQAQTSIAPLPMYRKIFEMNQGWPWVITPTSRRPTAIPPISTAVFTTTPETSEEASQVDAGEIVGIVVPTILVILVLILVIAGFMKRKQGFRKRGDVTEKDGLIRDQQCKRRPNFNSSRAATAAASEEPDYIDFYEQPTPCIALLTEARKPALPPPVPDRSDPPLRPSEHARSKPCHPATASASSARTERFQRSKTANKRGRTQSNTDTLKQPKQEVAPKQSWKTFGRPCVNVSADHNQTKHGLKLPSADKGKGCRCGSRRRAPISPMYINSLPDRQLTSVTAETYDSLCLYENAPGEKEMYTDLNSHF